MKKIILLVFVFAIAFSVGGCIFTGTLVYSNWQNNVYDCYLDGVWQGSVGSMGYLYVYGVPIGYHTVEADYWSGIDDPLGDYGPVAFYVAGGTNTWNFN